jgi:hypothetical protein
MNSPEPYSNAATPKKRSSIPFLVGFALLAAALYFLIPFATRQAMVLDEQAKAKAKLDQSLIQDTTGKIELSLTPKQMPTASMGGPTKGPTRMKELDPAVYFKTLDKDGNEQLDKSEVSGRLKSLMSVLDKDSDGVISREEFVTKIRIPVPEEEEDEEEATPTVPQATGDPKL